jgi:DNA (cytosine-5)-methyltransferase 1
MSKLKYIDLFAGCGGLSLGLHEAGWKGIFAVEKSPFAFSTLRHNLIEKCNHFDWPTWLDQKEHDINTILKTHTEQLRALRGSVDLVVGGPPCQGFSTAGKRVEGDNRNQLIHSYVDFIRIVQPKMIFFENVKGFTQKFEKNKSKGINYSELVKTALRRKGKGFEGYEVFGQLVNFADYGVPQKRTRFILVGIRKDLKINNDFIPEDFFHLIMTNRQKFLINKGLGLIQSLKDAISDLLEGNGKVPCPDSKNFFSAPYGKTETKYQKLLRGKKTNDSEIPDSHRFAKHSEYTISIFNDLITNAQKGKKIGGKDREQYNIKKRGIILLDENNPAPTITSHPDDYVHYSEPRILTVREYARIQTFPDWYEFKEKYTTGGKLRKFEVPRYTQVGNAIPPLFGEQAGQILKYFMDARHRNI